MPMRTTGHPHRKDCTPNDRPPILPLGARGLILIGPRVLPAPGSWRLSVCFLVFI
jgi:hypothetical protein